MDVQVFAVIAVALAACVIDLRTRRVPNVLTFGAALAAFGYWLAADGPGALGWSAAGWFTAVIPFVPFFALRGLGAGDVKLLGALGAWLGPLGALYLGLFTALAGGVLALGVVLARGWFAQTLRNIWVLLTLWRVAGLRPVQGLTVQDAHGPRLAYAVPIAVGALATLWMR